MKSNPSLSGASNRAGQIGTIATTFGTVADAGGKIRNNLNQSLGDAANTVPAKPGTSVCDAELPASSLGGNNGVMQLLGPILKMMQMVLSAMGGKLANPAQSQPQQQTSEKDPLGMIKQFLSQFRGGGSQEAPATPSLGFGNGTGAPLLNLGGGHGPVVHGGGDKPNGLAQSCDDPVKPSPFQPVHNDTYFSNEKPSSGGFDPALIPSRQETLGYSNEKPLGNLSHPGSPDFAGQFSGLTPLPGGGHGPVVTDKPLNPHSFLAQSLAQGNNLPDSMDLNFHSHTKGGADITVNIHVEPSVA